MSGNNSAASPIMQDGSVFIPDGLSHDGSGGAIIIPLPTKDVSQYIEDNGGSIPEGWSGASIVGLAISVQEAKFETLSKLKSFKDVEGTFEGGLDSGRCLGAS